MNVMNAELCKKAAEKVGNPNVLVNLISRRVRQLNAGGGGLGRPLVDVPASMGLADIALTEILEEKMGWEMPEETQPSARSQEAPEDSRFIYDAGDDAGRFTNRRWPASNSLVNRPSQL